MGGNKANGLRPPAPGHEGVTLEVSANRTSRKFGSNQPSGLVTNCKERGSCGNDGAGLVCLHPPAKSSNERHLSTELDQLRQLLR